MSNLTLSVDAGTLRRARIRAVNEDTSVNAQVRGFLQRYAAGDEVVDARRQATERIIELARQSHASSGPQGRTWTRDDLYER